MALTPELVSELMRRRRSIFPKTYNQKPIPRELVEEILENANWAPTHRLTEPWRFKVFMENSLVRLGAYLADFYKKNTPEADFSEAKYQKSLESPRRSACVIAICMKHDPAGGVPEWEELAAVACAVENMWLTCTSHGIGCYWSTPKAALEADEFLQLETRERCLGLFYMGYHDLPDLPGKRTPVEEKTTWYFE